MGSTALAAAVSYPVMTTQISHKGQRSKHNDNNKTQQQHLVRKNTSSFVMSVQLQSALTCLKHFISLVAGTAWCLMAHCKVLQQITTF